ncbi:MAG TPA: hypothetical protein VFS43_42095 [Polyangiaceae bacterium]|nr:hypothetical protein [Polyangiaceae bacterium]
MRASKRVAYGLLALAFAGAAAVHAAALLSPRLDPSAPPWRHALFVGINVACALGFVLRPRWLAAPFALLVVQQLFSHGGQALRAWREAGRVDVPSLAVLVVMPLALALLASDARAAGAGRAGAAGRA